MSIVDVKELRKGIFLLDEEQKSTGYLVVGEERALLIDTMNGTEDLKKLVKSLTDKPVTVVNTHGHPDHIFGNIYFDKAYINPKDIALTKEFSESEDAQRLYKEKGKKMPPFEAIHEGDTIDLGGRTLEIYEIPGHTPGGILLLLKEDRILFTGDAINHHLWMQLDHSVAYDEALKAMDRIMFLEAEADVILHGHAHDFDDISLLHCVRNGMQEIVGGKTENDSEYHWFGGVGKQHPFKVEEGKRYQQDDHVICYIPGK